MANTKYAEEVSEILSKLTEVLAGGLTAEQAVPLKELPTEKLVTEMQSIFDELKSRVVVPSTKALHELPIGAKIRDKNTQYYGAPVIWLLADHGYYGDTLSTLLSERILAFKAFDAAEPNNPDERRSKYGNNDYKVSNIGLWLNSDKEDWFEPLHEYDQAPTEGFVYGNPYADESGFLTNFSEEFKQKINDTIQGKVFLLSAEEVGLSNEGKALDLFNNEQFRKACPTLECVQIDGEGSADEPDWWWLRTPYASNSYYARNVSASGALNSNYANGGYIGARPALNLESTIRVTAEPDENGIHDIVWGHEK